MHKTLLVGAAAAVLVLAAGGEAAAQQRINLNETVSGRLEQRDPLTDRGTRFDRWRISASRGEQVVLSMESGDFDTYLQIGRSVPGGGFSELAADDDGSGTLNAQLVFTAQEGGDYEVRATSYGTDSYGAYTLSRLDHVPYNGANQGEYGLSYLPIDVGGYIDYDDAQDTDGRYYEGYQFIIPNQHTVRIYLESASMDPYVTLGVINPDGSYEALFYDDDSGGGLNSQFYFQSVADDVFEVRASTYGAGQAGDYRLIVEDVSTTSDGGLPSGVAVGGWLADSDFIDADGGIYEYRSFYARRGQRVTVTQRSSEFDSYLSVGQLNNEVYREIASDDDSGGGDTGLDSQLTFTAPRDGTYVAKVGSYSPGATGMFSLQVDIY